MADTTKIWPIFRWANWWLSDDLFTGIKNSFYFSTDMEIRQDAKSAYPKPVPAYADANTRAWIQLSATTTPACVLWSADDNGWLVGIWKYIYKVSWTTSSLLCTLPNTVCDIEIFNWYLYVSTRTYLYYKIINGVDHRSDMASATDNSDDYYWRCVTQLSNNWYHPLYWSDVCLCVWDKNKVHKVTKEIFDAMQDWFEVQSNYVVRFIDELWWYVRVTAVDEPYWTQILLRDKVSPAPTEVIPMEWYTATQSAIYNGYHYLLTNKWLGLINWYQYYLLKKADWEVWTSSHNWMCVYDDKLYFIANDWIYIYWAKNKNYADVLWLWHKVEEWYVLWAIWAYKNGILTTRWWQRVDGVRIPCYCWMNWWLAQTWELQTMCYFGTSMSEIKQSEYLRVGYHLWKQWAESWNIHIYYRTEADAIDDNPDNWGRHEATKPEWLYADWDMRSPFATTLKLNCRFQRIQFKFIVTNCVYIEWWVTKTKDTNLYSADLYYNVMLD